MTQENARLRSAVAVAQQQLHEAAEAAEGRALGEAAQALQGEQQAVQQAHLLVPTYLPTSSLHFTNPLCILTSISRLVVCLFMLGLLPCPYVCADGCCDIIPGPCWVLLASATGRNTLHCIVRMLCCVLSE